MLFFIFARTHSFGDLCLHWRIQGGGKGAMPPPKGSETIISPPKKKRLNGSRARRLVDMKWKKNKEISTLYDLKM